MTTARYRITPTFARPPRALIDRFRGLPSSTIGDAMQRTAALPSRIRPLNSAPLLGSAYTVNAPEGDNILLYYAIDNAQPGDVIVAGNAGFTERALCGEIMASLAKSRGIAGIVVDGAIRDSAELARMDFPVYSVASSPNGPYKNGPGTVNEPLSIGTQVVRPGDILAGDATGIVVIPAEEASEVASVTAQLVEKEDRTLAEITAGKGMDLTWMYDQLDGAGVIGKEG
ncbi:MAG: RraA family protein [Citricoccus sp.]